MSERKMAWIARIDAIEPIPNADAIEVATVGGWKCVVKKGEFQTGQLAIYASIDSWIPHEIAPFLSKGNEPREYNGVKGERLKTIRLKGQISQGLLLPVDHLENGTPFITSICADDMPEGYMVLIREGDDVTADLGIQKWEAPMNAQLAGICRSTFPSRVKRTDQERIQNLSKELKEWIDSDLHWEITEKLEGQSLTLAFFDDEIHVCSRNMDLKDTEGNTLWAVAKQNGLAEKLETYCREYDVEIALQGELIGPGVQGNIYGLKNHEFRLFDVFDIGTYSYIEGPQRKHITYELGLLHVPVIAHSANLKDTLGLASMGDVLKFVEKKSELADVNAEGMVFKCIENPNISFKAISNLYLLKQKD